MSVGVARPTSVWWVYATLAAYVAGFLLFPPRALLVTDEFHYVAQALAFAQGKLTLPSASPLYPPSKLAVASDYPVGTSLLQTPLVAVLGWRGAAALSVIALVVATLITMKWLREQGRDPRFAVLIPAFAGSLFYGRTAMSDVPSAASIALALWALFRAEGSARQSFVAGLLGGASLLFRDTNAALLAPIFAGAILRGRCRIAPLLLGGVIGAALRLGSAYALFGNAFYVRDPIYEFSVRNIGPNLVQYSLSLLVLFPLGAVLPFLYRGPRRAEMIAGVAALVMLFLLYGYGATIESGRLKGLILLSRYIVPLVPVLAFMAADVWPRWQASLSLRWRALLQRCLPVGFSAIAAAAFFVHPAVHRQESALVPVIQAIRHSSAPGIPIVTNQQTTLKYFNPAYDLGPLILRSYVKPTDIPGFVERYARLNIVFLDRQDTELFREDAQRNAAFIDELRRQCEVGSIENSTIAGMRLHVHSVSRCVQR